MMTSLLIMALISDDVTSGDKVTSTNDVLVIKTHLNCKKNNRNEMKYG
jgi:hypothetical protein